MKDFAGGFATVVKPALPAVVNISTSKMVKQPRGGGNPMFNDPLFRQFFGNQFGEGQAQPHPEREKSLGSGVIISADGYIVTNNHVIDGASDIKVQTSDRRDFTAKLIGTDPRSDVAVLKIEAKNLPTLPLGESSKMQVGDVVLAIGDPFGVGETVTMGIISATGRAAGIEDYEDFLQTDASINPGNSGGALINTQGECIGINTAILSNGGGGNQGIGFAIPIDMARRIVDEIMKNGKVVRGYMGLYIQDVTPELAQQFGLSQGGGALVGDVSPDGPAAKAGMVHGDIITKLNGQPVTTANDLRLQVSQTAPGTTIHLDVMHNGKSSDVAIKLGELPTDKDQTNANGSTAGSALDGVQVEALTPDIAQQLELPAGTHGVVVSRIDPSSTAADSGLQRGDIIQEVNRKRVTNEDDFNQALSGSGDKPILLLVNRGGRTLYLAVQPH
jgi:serine protease Do